MKLIDDTKTQKTLNEQQRSIVCWFSAANLIDWHNKKQLYEKIQSILEIGPSAFNTRISELITFGFFHINDIEDGPTYKFNQERYYEYLKKGGL